MPRRLLLFLGILLLLAPLASSRNSLAEADRYALQAPAASERNLDELAGYLRKVSASSEDRTRAIYRWVTDRIAYDTVSFFAGTMPDQSPETVLGRRTAVCAGYANLFEALATRCRLDCRVIRGEIRRDPEDPAGQQRSHAWVAVRFQGRWQLLDPTWGSGYVDFKSKRFNRRFNPYYFFVPPDQLIFSHIPAEREWQLLPRPRTLQEIEAMPHVTSSYFRYDVRAREQRGQLVSSQGLQLKFRTAPGVRLSASVYRGQQAEDEHLTLIQPEPDGWSVAAQFPATGSYKVVIWGTDDPSSRSFEYVMDYRVDSRRASNLRFPTYSGEYLSHRVQLESPRSYSLTSKKKTSFRVLVPDATDVQLIAGSSWIPLERQGQWFRGQVQLPPGEIKLSGRFPGNDSYHLLLGYRAD